MLPLNRVSLALALLACAAVALAAPDDDPEPASEAKEEGVKPAVDPDKAAADPKLAKLAAAHEQRSGANLRLIAVGVHSYCDKHASLPDDIRDQNGKALLSWRVAILPYIKQEKLYKEFKLDQPWDSRHNKTLLAKLPEAFASPRVRTRAKGVTVYQTFTGENAVFGRTQRLRIETIADGTSNTLLAVETSTAVPWTRPGGIPFVRGKALPDFGKALGQRPLAALMDGSTRVLDLKKIQAATLENVIDPFDGTVLGNDWSE